MKHKHFIEVSNIFPTITLIGNEELLIFWESRKQGLKLHLIFLFLNWLTVPQTTCYKDIVCLNFGLLAPHRGVDLR